MYRVLFLAALLCFLLAAIDPFRCFVANSAVSTGPVVKNSFMALIHIEGTGFHISW